MGDGNVVGVFALGAFDDFAIGAYLSATIALLRVMGIRRVTYSAKIDNSDLESVATRNLSKL